MNIYILFDSLYGNTERIANALGSKIPKTHHVTIAHIDTADLSGIRSTQLLIVGSPTHGGRPKPTLTAFLDSLPGQSLAGIRVAAFDTRLQDNKQNIALRLLMRIIGYAAPKIAATLVSKGAVLAATEGFIVTGTKGPLEKHEEKRAALWAKNLLG